MKNTLVAIGGLLILSATPAMGQSARMNFFISSAGSGEGANFGGLAGADDLCARLGYAAGAGDLTWRAYLSTQVEDGAPAVNARDRIGAGPWYNYRGVLIAENLEQLHSEESGINKETALTNQGRQVNGRGDSPNQHDILTGSQPDGTAFPAGDDRTCGNWTSAGEGSAQVGHHDRVGGGANPTSWNSAHASRGCSQENLIATGGNGLIYCFGV